MPSPRRAGRSRQPAVDELLFQIKASRLPKPVTERQFHPERKWRFDISWSHSDITYTLPRIPVPGGVAVEVDGGLFVNGGHTRGAARERDYERDAEAMKLGWRVLRVSPRQVREGKAIQWITDLLK